MKYEKFIKNVTTASAVIFTGCILAKLNLTVKETLAHIEMLQKQVTQLDADIYDLQCAVAGSDIE